MGLVTIPRLFMAYLILSGTACAHGGPRVEVLNVTDSSNIADAAYQLCRDEYFVRSSLDLESYLSASKEIAAEQWTELDHYPCEKKFMYAKDGVRHEVRVNLSGAGLISVGEKTRFLSCDTRCKQAAGWSPKIKRDGDN